MHTGRCGGWLWGGCTRDTAPLAGVAVGARGVQGRALIKYETEVLVCQVTKPGAAVLKSTEYFALLFVTYSTIINYMAKAKTLNPADLTVHRTAATANLSFINASAAVVRHTDVRHAVPGHVGATGDLPALDEAGLKGPGVVADGQQAGLTITD